MAEIGAGNRHETGVTANAGTWRLGFESASQGRFGARRRRPSPGPAAARPPPTAAAGFQRSRAGAPMPASRMAVLMAVLSVPGPPGVPAGPFLPALPGIQGGFGKSLFEGPARSGLEHHRGGSPLRPVPGPSLPVAQKARPRPLRGMRPAHGRPSPTLPGRRRHGPDPGQAGHRLRGVVAETGQEVLPQRPISQAA